MIDIVRDVTMSSRIASSAGTIYCSTRVFNNVKKAKRLKNKSPKSLSSFSALLFPWCRLSQVGCTRARAEAQVSHGIYRSLSQDSCQTSSENTALPMPNKGIMQAGRLASVSDSLFNDRLLLRRVCLAIFSIHRHVCVNAYF